MAEDGTVSVTYYDFRNNTNDPDTLPTDYWVVHCHTSATVDCSQGSQYDNARSGSPTPRSTWRGPGRPRIFVGDYEGLANDIGEEGTDFAPFFSQTQASDPASIFFRRVSP